MYYQDCEETWRFWVDFKKLSHKSRDIAKGNSYPESTLEELLV